MIRLILAVAVTLTGFAARADVAIHEMTTPGGIDAWLVEANEIPFIALEVRIDGGGGVDRPGKRGAVNLMTALIEEGSADMDARAFQVAREALAASFDFAAYDDSVAISARFLTENADAAIALLHQAISEPRFDVDAVDRVRAQVIAGLASDAQRPNSIAGEAFYAAAFPDHPYGSVIDGTVETVTALTQDDMFDAWQDAVNRAPGRVHVSVVGDIDAAGAAALIDTLFDGLVASGPDLPADVAWTAAGDVTVIDFATPQSVALFGQPGLKRDDPDFFAAHVLNHILGGGGFESRLMNEVREKRGLTYGVSTYLIPREHAELLIGSVASANDRIAETIEVIRAVWADTAANGVTQEELDAAKTYITGEYPLRFDGNGDIADIMVGLQQIGLTPEYVTNRNAQVEAVTLEDVNRVAAYLLTPDALDFVVVGQPTGIETTN